MNTFRNNNVWITYSPKTESNPRPDIFLKDLTDVYNETSAYTTKLRGLPLAWKFIEQIMTCEDLKDDLNFRDIVNILDDKFNLSTHIYCAMD